MGCHNPKTLSEDDDSVKKNEVLKPESEEKEESEESSEKKEEDKKKPKKKPKNDVKDKENKINDVNAKSMINKMKEMAKNRRKFHPKMNDNNYLKFLDDDEESSDKKKK